MGVALRIKKASITGLWRPVALLISLGMLGMWLASSALAFWLFGLPFWTALLLGAIVSPTDPVVTSSIVSGSFAEEHLPLRLRDTISFESGANDGLAYAFVLLPLLMIEHAPGDAWTRWLTETLLLGVLGGVLLGVLIGRAAAWLLAFAVHRGIVQDTSLLGYTIAFSLMTLGIAELLGAGALIAVFTAGLVFNFFSERHEEHEEENIQEAIAKLFTLPMFVLFGIALPFAEWARMGWPLLAFAALILLARRPPVMALLAPLLRPWLTRADLAYAGWFGPIGIAAMFYAAFAFGRTGEPVLWHAASAVIFASIVIHGLTAAPFTRRYARKASAAGDPVRLPSAAEEL